ncbi:glycerate kinase [Corynebacterium aquatimens]|uniref:Glycerate kinase n=1 Tax=Corynebacterium aquatimens TaxID=1190508 RepID=A0A931DX51_9CORY|nr:glycerate kinase [Corynebacterium aquatimens]MBG6121907.1 glycerate kinase [Corynebacterium aquatimens]WJY65555.1 Glycerate kinase [Corynebacterium aquatimens]
MSHSHHLDAALDESFDSWSEDFNGGNASSLKIVVAPDSFKGTAPAYKSSEWISEGVQSVIRDAKIDCVPMADGGEGTASLFDGEEITLPTTDAAGRLTEATYVFNATEARAYIDVAAASGLPAVKDNPVPLTGDTYGTGVLVADAVSRGARTIVLGLGGSATIDGGTGILAALGINALDKDGHALRHGGGALVDLADFDTAKMNIPAASVDWILLADSAFPATGERGAARVFGPQKGASEDEVELADRALARLCEVTGVDPDQPGYGAAGGISIGLTWISTLLHGTADHVTVVSGSKTVAQAQGLPEKIADAHLVITGEGNYDDQSAGGKVVSTVLDLAKDAGTAAAVIAGAIDAKLDPDVLTVELGDAPDPNAPDFNEQVREKLVDAGAQVALDYLQRP